MARTPLHQHIRLGALAAALALALGSLALAQDSGEDPPAEPEGSSTEAPALPVPTEDRLVASYADLVGSEAGVRALVRALRTGASVTLASETAPTATFTPTTSKMGLGNIDISLALAQASLAAQGIAEPTPEQLQTALNGGELTLEDGTLVDMNGVLQMRADGMGWGQIAQSLGTKLGTLMGKAHGQREGKGKSDDDGASASSNRGQSTQAKAAKESRRSSDTSGDDGSFDAVSAGLGHGSGVGRGSGGGKGKGGGRGGGGGGGKGK